MSFDHHSVRSSPALMPQLDNPKSTLCKNMETHEASFWTAQTNVNEDNDDIGAWAELLKEGDVRMELRGYTQRWSKQKSQRWLNANYKSKMSSHATRKGIRWLPHRSPAQRSRWLQGNSKVYCGLIGRHLASCI